MLKAGGSVGKGREGAPQRLVEESGDRLKDIDLPAWQDGSCSRRCFWRIWTRGWSQAAPKEADNSHSLLQPDQSPPLSVAFLGPTEKRASSDLQPIPSPFPPQEFPSFEDGLQKSKLHVLGSGRC